MAFAFSYHTHTVSILNFQWLKLESHIHNLDAYYLESYLDKYPSISFVMNYPADIHTSRERATSTQHASVAPPPSPQGRYRCSSQVPAAVGTPSIDCRCKRCAPQILVETHIINIHIMLTTKTRKLVLGIFLLILVDFLWVLSSELTKVRCASLLSEM